MKIDPGDSRIVYASLFGPGLFASQDGGATWQLLPAASPDQRFSQNFVVDPSNAQRLLAATQVGLFISNDRGLTWAATSITDEVLDVDVDPTSSQIIYVTYGDGRIAQSSDGGATWTR